MDEEHLRHRFEPVGLIRRPGRSEAGFSSVQWVVMISFGMILLLMMANLIAMQYGAGAVRAAVDEGARWGAALGRDASDCEARAMQMLRGDNGLLGGSMGDTIEVRCEVVGGELVATATGEFQWWFGGVPDAHVEIVGRSVVEPDVATAGGP